MQVITGKYRARRLESLDTSDTRPTLARVKESIFSMIDYKIAGSVVLDLFAGSGAMGIEAISRGAEKVYFVDANPKAKVVLTKNLRNVTEPFDIFIGDYLDALHNFKRQNIKFDLVFLDPPYASNFGDLALSFLYKNDLLNKDALVVFEQEGKNCLQNDPEGYIIEKSKKYGTASVCMLSLED